ncbi:hypothetical protein UFOVP257_40 [uncultured Caudovirales phage]|uniref:Uncharacterized protein n=1 Tax=uncultured Caudovirales phage TaxID=2100421 RepID=A0A6J5LMT1_9CAUD|nr:hypothetical protein UFOVP257_40 [uncultured Caudovirales phage]
MSNNIYDILKKMAGLESPQQKKSVISESKESKMCNECGMLEAKCKCDHSADKKADKKKDKGAIAEAVARVEATLTEKYKDMEESGLQAYLGNKKYGKEGMNALRKAGRDGASKEKMANIRAKHDKFDEDVSNEDMLSPKQKKIAKLSPPPDKIDGGDFAKLRAGKKTNEGEMTPKQKKFAKLAPPPDKITYADKIAGATKSKKVEEGFEDLEKYMKEKEGKTTHGKKTKTKTGLKHERDYDKEDNEKDTGEEKKGRGRPTKDKFAKKDKK